MMGLHPTLFSLLSLAAAAFFFSLAIQRPTHDRVRPILGVLHTLSDLLCLIAISRQPSPSSYSQFAVPLIIGFTVHSTAIVFVHNSVVKIDGSSYSQRICTVYRIRSNVRNLPLGRYEASPPKEPGNKRLWFAAKRCARLSVLWCIQRGASLTISFISRHLRVTVEAFSTAHQGLVPSASDKEVRGIMSFYWIWTSYYSLTTGHDLASSLFVTVLGWDRAEEWPPLFGNLKDAYTLRRFWGVFWHRLHVHPFTLCMPSTRFVRIKLGHGALVSFWVFTLAALSHAAVNLVLYRQYFLICKLRFFLLNWAVCFAETIMRNTLGETRLFRKASSMKCLGRVWVFTIFFCIVPGWYYPKLHHYAERRW